MIHLDLILRAATPEEQHISYGLVPDGLVPQVGDVVSFEILTRVIGADGIPPDPFSLHALPEPADTRALEGQEWRVMARYWRVRKIAATDLRAQSTGYLILSLDLA